MAFINEKISSSFFRAEVRNGERRHLIFATDHQLQLLKKAKTWYIDGTFKVVRQPFYQLLSIHTFVRSGDDMKQLPLLFAVMAGKTSEDYTQVIVLPLQFVPLRIFTYA
jgi:hypothetical protein